MNSILPYTHRRVLVLKETTSVQEAARALHEKNVGCVIVSNSNGKIIGLATDRDLSTQILGFELPINTPLFEVMTDNVLSAEKSATIDDVVEIMETNGIRRVPIIEETNQGKEKCIGIVTLDDLIASESVGVQRLARIVRAQIRRTLADTHFPKKNDDRREQTYNRFNKLISKHMDLPRDIAEKITLRLLKEIVQRVSFTEACHFISQLPSFLHEDLFNLPAGPNININENTILNKLMAEFQLDRATVIDLTRKFWDGLEDFLDIGILRHLLAQLPFEMKNIFRDEVTSLPVSDHISH